MTAAFFLCLVLGANAGSEVPGETPGPPGFEEHKPTRTFRPVLAYATGMAGTAAGFGVGYLAGRGLAENADSALLWGLGVALLPTAPVFGAALGVHVFGGNARFGAEILGATVGAVVVAPVALLGAFGMIAGAGLGSPHLYYGSMAVIAAAAATLPAAGALLFAYEQNRHAAISLIPLRTNDHSTSMALVVTTSW